VVDLDETPDAAAARLLARTVAPVVTELTISGSALVKCVPGRLPDLFAGAPALISLELAPAGGTLTVRGVMASGPFERTLTVAANDGAEGHAAIPALFAREAVEDLELLAAVNPRSAGVDKAIEEMGLTFQLSTRLTSWVAVSEEATVDPRQPTRRERMPQQLPYGMSVEGLGLRAGAACMAPPPPVPSSPPMAPPPSRLAHYSVVPPTPAPSRPVFMAPPRQAPAERAEGVTGSRGGVFGVAMHLPARLVLRTPDRLVVEIDAPEEPIAWFPGSMAVAYLADGSTLELEIDASATTAEEFIEPGATIRLVLRLKAPLPASLGPVRIELPDASLELVLQPASP
jgi:Ca-activated chloride channel homolog